MDELSLTRFGRCIKCGMTFPATRRYFAYSARHKFNCFPVCKACSARKPEYQRAKMFCPDGKQACSICLQNKPATTDYFHTHRTGKQAGRLTAHCKECQRARHRRYYEQPEYAKAARENAAEWYAANKDCAAAQRREYERKNREKLRPKKREAARGQREANRELYNEKARQRYQSNPEMRQRQAETHKKWAQENRDRVLLKNRNYFARRAGAAGSHTVEEVWQMYEDQGGVCAYCEGELNGKYIVEHMTPLSRGGSNDWSNLAISCLPCNSSKKALTVEEFVERRPDIFDCRYYRRPP